MCEKINEKKDGTDCTSCLKPLPPEDQDAAIIYLKCRSQLKRAPMGEPLDIDFNAVEIAMQRSGIESDYVFWQVVQVAREFIAKNRQ